MPRSGDEELTAGGGLGPGLGGMRAAAWHATERDEEGEPHHAGHYVEDGARGEGEVKFRAVCVMPVTSP